MQDSYIIKALQEFGLSEKEAELCLVSRDAIIPVIEKQNMRIKDTIAGILYTLQSRGEHQFLATPRQLAIALLKATGGGR